MHYWLLKLKYFYYELEDRVRRLGIKEWINRHPRVVIGIAAASFLLFIVVAIGQLIPDRPEHYQEPEKVWFYDLNTKELFTAKSSKLPPIKTSSGPLPDGSPAGMRAYVYDDPEQQKPVVVFLEMFSEEGKKNQKDYDPQKHTAKEWAKGRFFCRPDEQEWFPADSSQGQAMYKEYYERINHAGLSVKTENGKDFKIE